MGAAGNWLITASHHQLHHQRNKCNYGLYFRFWDRLCATDGGLGSFEPRARRASLAQPRATTDIHVEIAGLRDAKGLVRLCLTSDPRAFPQVQGSGCAACHDQGRATAAALRIPLGASGNLRHRRLPRRQWRRQIEHHARHADRRICLLAQPLNEATRPALQRSVVPNQRPAACAAAHEVSSLTF